MSTTFFDNKKSFTDIPTIENKISTTEFLDASEVLIALFDLLGSTAFNVVQNDLKGNVNKLRERLTKEPSKSLTLQDLVINENAEKKTKATQGLLWLSRGLQFTSQALRETINDPSKELNKTFTDAYNKTLSKYHSFVIKPVFKLAMNACPYRKDFFKKLGTDQNKVDKQLEEWLVALEKIVKIIFDFFEQGGYGKGL